MARVISLPSDHQYEYPQHRTYYTAGKGEIPSSSDSWGIQRGLAGQRGEWSSSYPMYKPREGQSWTPDVEMLPRRKVAYVDSRGYPIQKNRWDYITASPTLRSPSTSSSQASGAWPFQYVARIASPSTSRTSDYGTPPKWDDSRYWRSRAIHKRLRNGLLFLTIVFLSALLTSTVRHQSKLQDTECDVHLSNSEIRMAYLVFRLLLAYCVIGIILWLVVIQKCVGCPFCCGDREKETERHWKCTQTIIVWLSAGLLLTGVMTFIVWNAIEESCISLYSKLDEGFLWTSFRAISCFSIFALGVMIISILLNLFFCTCCRNSTINTHIGTASFKAPRTDASTIFTKEEFVSKFSPEPARHRCHICGEDLRELRCKDCWLRNSFLKAGSPTASTYRTNPL